jgi:predicted metalloprotease with PDZ domain
MVRYTVFPVSPQAHLFRVTLKIERPDSTGQVLTLPAWIFGSYMIRDFAKNIVRLTAQSDNREIPILKVDKQTWKCDPVDGALELVYEVYAWDLSVRSAHLDNSHGYFNGTSLFLKVLGQEDVTCEVNLLPPDGESFQQWKVATTLKALDRSGEFGVYLASDYDDLVDHPVEMGIFDLATFEAGKIPHQIALTGKHKADLQRVCSDLTRLCNHHIEFFGQLPQMDRYLFQVMAVGEGYGGLEHRSSTSLICSRNDLPLIGDEKVSEGYRQFLGLASHEYFHLWNVKRIRPEVLKNADLSREVHTTLLWAFEGITSYYDDLSLVRTGLIKPESYLELLGRVITRVMRNAGRLKQSVADSSFDAWTKFYKQDENAQNAIVSYYTKGALVALALDLTIRQHTSGAKSLDDLMRALWQRYGVKDLGVGEADVEELAEEISGTDLKAFFDHAVRGTEDLPLEELLGTVGIGLRLRPARNAKDLGGQAVPDGEAVSAKPALGARYGANGNDVQLQVIFDHGAAQEAGLSAGDLLMAVDGVRVTMANLEALIEQVPAGESVKVHAFRRDELLELLLTPLPSPADTCDLWLLDDVDEEVLASRRSWLQLD